MNISKLLQMDMGSAIDWLIDNQDSFALVPKVPTMDMCEAFHEAQEEWEDGNGLESPDHQWGAMLATYEKESNQQ